MTPRLFFRRIPFGPGWLPPHKGCTTHWDTAKLSTAPDQPGLLTMGTGSLDKACTAFLMQGRRAKGNIYHLTMYWANQPASTMMRLGSRRVRVPQGSYLLVNPKEFSMHDPDTGFQGTVMSFSQTMLRIYREMTGIPKTAGPFDFDSAVRRPDARLAADVAALTGRIRGGRPNETHAWLPLLVFGEGGRVLADLWASHPNQLRSRLAERGGGDSADPRIQKAVEAMRHQLGEPLRIPQVAKAGGVSVATLHRLFEGQLGMAPHQFFRQLRLEHAERLLRLSPKPDWRTIAHAVGFGTSWALKKAFKKTKGLLPAT